MGVTSSGQSRLRGRSRHTDLFLGNSFPDVSHSGPRKGLERDVCDPRVRRSSSQVKGYLSFTSDPLLACDTTDYGTGPLTPDTESMPDIENPASLVFGRDSWRGPHSYRCKCYKNLLKHPDAPPERHVAPRSSRKRRFGTAYSLYFRSPPCL